MTYSKVFSPRGSRKLWPADKTRRETRLTFTPKITIWRGPSPPPSFGSSSKKEKEEEVACSADALNAYAEQLREQAAATSGETRKPPVGVLLGRRLLEENQTDGRRESTKSIESLVKAWDQKGKGEVVKAQMVSCVAQHCERRLTRSSLLPPSLLVFFSYGLSHRPRSLLLTPSPHLCPHPPRQRVNLRKVGLEVSSSQADLLFDAWDPSGGGSIDLDELRVALKQAVADAEAFATTSDPADVKRQQLLKMAAHAAEAAEAVALADSLDRALEEERRRSDSRVDLQLGSLLQKRMIKPGEVSMHHTCPVLPHTAPCLVMH